METRMLVYKVIAQDGLGCDLGVIGCASTKDDADDMALRLHADDMALRLRARKYRLERAFIKVLLEEQ